MSLQKRIYYRAKNRVRKEDLSELARRHNLDASSLQAFPLDLLESLDTTSNYKKESTILLDIGAHEGLFTAAANLIFDFEQSICFEPNSDLNNAIKQKNQNSNTQIANIALSDSKGTAIFHLHQDSAMNSIVDSDRDVLKSEFPWDNPDLMTSTDVPTDTLDGYLSAEGFQDKKFFIKVDTQGNELNVLKHGTKTLKNTEIVLIEYMFFSPYTTDFTFLELIQFLDQQGFECKGALTIKKRPSKKVSAVDFLFVKKQTQTTLHLL